MKKKLRWLLGIVFGLLLLYSGYRIVEILSEYAQTEAAQRDAINQVVIVSDEELPAAVVQDVSLESPGEGALETTTSEEVPPISVDFDALRAINPEIVGWLYCADTPINYPVAQTGNNTYYLNHLYNGKTNRSGTLFVDCVCSPDFTDFNTVIYGHHMKSGSMFASLVEYRSQEYYEAHPTLYLLTPKGNYRLDVFGGYVAQPGSQRLFSLDEENEFAAYLGEIQQLSDFNAEMDVTSQDHIVTLSTCTYEFSDARYLVFAAMKEIGG
jgi:sortase B